MEIEVGSGRPKAKAKEIIIPLSSFYLERGEIYASQGQGQEQWRGKYQKQSESSPRSYAISGQEKEILKGRV